MKTDFEARPVYVKRRDRILAHFMTCFIALIVYRYLERKLGGRYTIDQILSTLREMDFMKYEGKGYQPVYTRTELTDALHDAFGFCTQSAPRADFGTFLVKRLLNLKIIPHLARKIIYFQLTLERTK